MDVLTIFPTINHFLLPIYTLTDAQLKLLDTLTDKFVKKWAGLLPSATNAILHMTEGLDFKAYQNCTVTQSVTLH